MLFRSLIKDSAYVLIAKVLNSASSLALSVVIARELTVADMGVYAYLLSVASLIVFIGSLGSNEFLYKRGSENSNKIKFMLYASRLSRIFICVLLCLCVLLFNEFVTHDSVDSYLLVLAVLVIFFDNQTVTSIVIARSQGNMQLETFVYFSRGIIKLVLLILVSMLHKTNLFLILVTILSANILALWYASAVAEKKYLRKENIFTVSTKYIILSLRSSFPYFLMGLVGLLSTQTDVLLLGFLKEDAEVAYFIIPMQIYQTLLFLPVSIHIVTQPYFVRVYSKEIYVWYKQLNKLISLTILTSLIIVLLFYKVMPYLVLFAFGEKYLPSINIINILILAFSVKTFVIVVIQTSYISANKMRLFTTHLSISLGLHLLASIYLIQLHGALGAAWGLLIADMLMLIFYAFDFFKGAFDRD